MQLVSNSVNLLQKHGSGGVENKDVLKIKAKDGHTDRQATMQITSLSACFFLDFRKLHLYTHESFCVISIEMSCKGKVFLKKLFDSEHASSS